jgi:hypothetical protein
VVDEFSGSGVGGFTTLATRRKTIREGTYKVRFAAAIKDAVV